MNEVVIGLISVICVAIFAGILFSVNTDVEMYKELYDECLKKVIFITNENIKLKNENMKLKDQLTVASMYKNYPKPSIDKDVVEAVKYAMKYAHPDNGGKQEDFVKFNNLYNKIR